MHSTDQPGIGCSSCMCYNVEHDGVLIEYWKIEVAVFLPLPHPKNKTFVDSHKVELYSYTQLPPD
jgi:hypothetical protein